MQASLPIDAQQSLPSSDRRIEQGSEKANTRIIDEDARQPSLGFELKRQRLVSRPISHIKYRCPNIQARLRRLSGEFRQPFCVDIGRRHVRARPRESQNGFSADAIGCTCH